MAFANINKIRSRAQELIDAGKKHYEILNVVSKASSIGLCRKIAVEGIGDFEAGYFTVSDVLAAYANLSSYSKVKRAVQFNMSVETKKEVTEVSYGGNSYSYMRGFSIGLDTLTTEDVLNNTAERIGSMIKEEPQGFEIVTPSTSLPTPLIPDMTKITKIVGVCEDKGIKTVEAATDFLKKEIVNEESNPNLVSMFVGSAPERVELYETTSKAGLVYPNASQLKTSKKATTEQVESTMYALSKGTVPTKTKWAEYNARHVYGIPIPKEVQRYVELNNDLIVPDDVKKFHLYSADIKYALMLLNRFHLPVAIKSHFSLRSDNKSIQYMTQSELDDDIYDKDDKDNGVMAIFVDVEKVPDTYKKGTIERPCASYFKACRDHDKKFKYRDKYKRYFRYVSAFAISGENQMYRISCGARSGKVIETTINPMFVADQVLRLTAFSMLHSYLYIWINIPFNRMIKEFPPLLGLDLRLSKETAKDISDSSVTAFLRSVKEPDLLEIYEEEIVKLTESQPPDKKQVNKKKKIIEDGSETEEDSLCL